MADYTALERPWPRAHGCIRRPSSKESAPTSISIVLLQDAREGRFRLAVCRIVFDGSLWQRWSALGLQPHVSQSEASQRRVLIVEDFDDARDLYVVFFADAGYVVSEASNGEEALAAVAIARPDCIVMDVAMPTMDGIEATRRIKSDPATQSIVIVVVSGHSRPDDIRRAQEAGADAVLPKPCLPETLLAEVVRLMSVSQK